MPQPVPGPADTPGVRIPPPAFYVTGFLAGLALDGAGLPAMPGWARWPGLAAAAAGLALVASAVATFRRAGTHIDPRRPASTVVLAGPYRLTRNPMYVGFALVHTGLGLWLGSAGALVVLPVVLVAVDRLVVVREERHLASAFGPDYERYSGRVRRWL